MSFTVTGNTSSRLNELKKIKPSNIFTEKYYGNGSYTNNGVDYLNSIENVNIIYYINNVKYNDIYLNGIWITTYEYESVDIDNNPNFINQRIIKNENKSKLISNPKIKNDVFIDRQEISVFDKNYRLEFINNLGDLISYAGGGYYKIVKNS